MHESLDISIFHMLASEDKDEKNSVMADFMLTGIFKGGAYSGGSSADQDGLVIARDDNYRVDYGFLLPQSMSISVQLRGLNEHIRAFSKRCLTKDTDSLLAFQGVVGMYEKTESLYLFNGIPIWTGNIYGTAAAAQLTFALSVSSWYHRASPDHAMFVSESCRRRTHLPSWTWAGWNGTVSWRAPPNLEHCAYMSDLIKTTKLSIVWAASIYLSQPELAFPVRLLGSESIARLTNGTLATMEIRDPFILSQWERVEDTNREWSWQSSVGRPGREELSSAAQTWDKRWYRIGRRLAFIAMSITMSPQQWTAKHASGELISVLLFTGRYIEVEHGTARFMTLRKVSSNPPRWERVGTLYLIIPFLASCRTTSGLFYKIPARKDDRTIVIQ